MGSALGAVKGAVNILKDGQFAYALLTSPTTAQVHNCAGHNCKINQIDEEIELCRLFIYPFKGWRESKCCVRVIAEHDGCNVLNAYVTAGRSEQRWWSPRQWNIIVNQAFVSASAAGNTGCPNCCAEASCVEFIASYSTNSAIGASWSRSVTIRVCGDGSVKKA